MKLFCLQTGCLAVNSYFLINEKTRRAVLIDGGEDYSAIKRAEKELNVKITALLLTHGHFDHCGNAKKLQEDGVKVYISVADESKLRNHDNLSEDFGKEFDCLFADYVFSDGEKLIIEGFEIDVLITSGHTNGSAVFIVDDMMFTGDTLFCKSVGRTDFPTGNKNQLIDSVKRLFALPKDYKVYPGHNEFTTLENERNFNILAYYD